MSIMQPSAEFDPPAPTLDEGHPCSQCGARSKAICGVLESDELQAFRKSGSTQRLEPGDTLFFEGDPARSVYSITEGLLRLTKMLPDGRRQVADFLFPGDFLGLTLEDGHAFSAEAVTPAQVCLFSAARFQAFAGAHPHLERRLYVLAAHELAATRQQVLRLGRKSATERIASFLLMLASHNCPGPCGNGDGKMLFLPMSRTDIADYLGLRIETVSREFSHLKADKIIRLVSTQQVEILDEARLRAIVTGDLEEDAFRSFCD